MNGSREQQNSGPERLPGSEGGELPGWGELPEAAEPSSAEPATEPLCIGAQRLVAAAAEEQQACYEKVAQWMRELFGEQFTVPLDDSSAIGLMYGSTVAQTSAFPSKSGDDTLVCKRALVAAAPEITPELTRYLLEENAEMTFGAFGLDEDGDVIFEHSVIGSSRTREQLRHSVMAAAMAEDRYGEEIVARWGGERARGRLDRDEKRARRERVGNTYRSEASTGGACPEDPVGCQVGE